MSRFTIGGDGAMADLRVILGGTTGAGTTTGILVNYKLIG